MMTLLRTLVFAFTVLFSFGLPIGLLFWWKRKTHIGLWPFVVGAICFFVFAMCLEQLLHAVCLMGNNPLSAAITGSPWLYALYGGLAAGVFEEVGRLFGFRTLLRRQKQPSIDIAYGIGHGGIEAIFTLGITYVLYFLAILGVPFGAPEENVAVHSVIGQISTATVLVACFERLAAVTLHIALSILVFRTACGKGSKWFLFAILIHAAADFPAVFCQLGLLPVWVVEAWCAFVGVATLLFALKRRREELGETSR